MRISASSEKTSKGVVDFNWLRNNGISYFSPSQSRHVLQRAIGGLSENATDDVLRLLRPILTPVIWKVFTQKVMLSILTMLLGVAVYILLNERAGSTEFLDKLMVLSFSLWFWVVLEILVFHLGKRPVLGPELRRSASILNSQEVWELRIPERVAIIAEILCSQGLVPYVKIISGCGVLSISQNGPDILVWDSQGICFFNDQRSIYY